MAEILNTSEILLARLAEGLDSTAKMTQALLSDLREGEADFAAMKTELNILKDNVKGLAELVRDGGASSILTKVALIEQNIDNIKKWIDCQANVQVQKKKDFDDVQNQLADIEYRLGVVELTLKQIKDNAAELEREKRASIDREADLENEKRKNDDKIRAEKQSAFVKVMAAIMIGVVGLVGGYLANSCTIQPTKLNSTETQQNTSIASITSSVDSQNL
jgi:chromosome segregation ATPase